MLQTGVQALQRSTSLRISEKTYVICCPFGTSFVCIDLRHPLRLRLRCFLSTSYCTLYLPTPPIISFLHWLLPNSWPPCSWFEGFFIRLGSLMLHGQLVKILLLHLLSGSCFFQAVLSNQRIAGLVDSVTVPYVMSLLLARHI